jgi:putative SOS response-associated peptidase YedK
LKLCLVISVLNQSKDIPPTLTMTAYGAVHPKAMPVILRTEGEVSQWLAAPPDEAMRLQRPLADGVLKIVATGEREDAASTNLA